MIGGRLRDIFRVFIAVMICLILFGNETAHAVSAINQLCGAAGYGAGCVKAFKPSGVRPSGGMRPGVGGGNMLGGMLGSIAASLITDLIIDAATSSAANAAGAGNIPSRQLSSQTSALQRAVEQQRKFEEERQQQLLSKMVDVSASQFKDSSSDLTILENASAKAGAPFDGNAPMPDGQWESMHDAWFSTSSTGQAEGIQPLKMSDQSLDYTKDGTDSMKCMNSMGGQICSFPSGRPPVMKLDTISVPSPPVTTVPNIPTVPTAPATTPVVQSQWVPYKDSIIAMARRKIGEVGEMITDPREQAEMLLTTFVNFGSSALPGIQGEIATQNIETYKGFMNKLIGNTFEILTDAINNPEEAIRKSDPEELARSTRDALLDSAPSSVKVVIASLTGRPDEAFEASNEIIVDEAKEAAMDKIKDKARDTAKHYLDKVEHWLLKL